VDAGVRGSTVDEADLIAAVQALAVRKHNVLISQVQFLNMGQEREESALSYSARLRGKSNLCNFNVLCAGCEIEVSYTDKIMAHQFVRGLVDPVVQEKILAKASGGEELEIKELTTMVEALEMGKRSQALLVGSGGLNRVSDYRQAKDGQKRTQQQGQQGPGKQGPGRSLGSGGKDQPRCNFCGSQRHGSSREERAGQCPALDKDCNLCHKRGHFAHKCPTNKTPGVRAVAVVPAVAPVVPVAAAQTGAVSAYVEDGSFFCMSVAERSPEGEGLEVKSAGSVAERSPEGEGLGVKIWKCLGLLVSLLVSSWRYLVVEVEGLLCQGPGSDLVLARALSEGDLCVVDETGSVAERSPEGEGLEVKTVEGLLCQGPGSDLVLARALSEGEGMVAQLGERHHVFLEDRWMEQAVKQHPFLQGLRVELDREAYKQRSLQEPRTRTRPLKLQGLADTGAQMTIIGP
jgi:hypothetical protein